MTKAVVWLTGEYLGLDTNDNAFAILAQAKRAMRKFGVDKAVIEAFAAEAKAGDYDHLQQVVREWCGVEDTDATDG